MARTGITYNEVAQAADALVAQGENPTINKVRASLGSGSPNTIHKHLTNWRAAAPVQERKAPELPADLQLALVKELERHAAKARSELEKELIQTQEEAEELATTGEQLERDMDQLTERNQELSEEAQRLGALTEEKRIEILKLETELKLAREAAESARIEVAQGRNKVESLGDKIVSMEAALLEIRNDLKTAESARIIAEKAAAVAETRREALEAEALKQANYVTMLEKALVTQKAESDSRSVVRETELKERLEELKSSYEQRIEELKKHHAEKTQELVKEKTAA